ncbi:MAG: hypothetical protein KDA24_07765 [Deltaproteobacteria bacterium]|nr:hypothetical protein [Deltaproteobacteria bacterium]
MNKLLLALFALLLVSGCPEEPTYVYPIDLNDVVYTYYDGTEGIFPSTSILDHPDNPFATSGMDNVNKWEVESSGAAAAAFYSWAMINVQGAHGEAQYYTALNLQRIFQRELAAPEDLYAVRTMAIDAYQAVLDNFPNDVTFAAEGFVLPLNLLAYDGIVALGGNPQGGWVRITGDNGNGAVVQSLDI